MDNDFNTGDLYLRLRRLEEEAMTARQADPPRLRDAYHTYQDIIALGEGVPEARDFVQQAHEQIQVLLTIEVPGAIVPLSEWLSTQFTQKLLVELPSWIDIDDTGYLDELNTSIDTLIDERKRDFEEKLRRARGPPTSRSGSEKRSRCRPRHPGTRRISRA